MPHKKAFELCCCVVKLSKSNTCAGATMFFNNDAGVPKDMAIIKESFRISASFQEG